MKRWVYHQIAENKKQLIEKEKELKNECPRTRQNKKKEMEVSRKETSEMDKQRTDRENEHGQLDTEAI